MTFCLHQPFRCSTVGRESKSCKSRLARNGLLLGPRLDGPCGWACPRSSLTSPSHSGECRCNYVAFFFDICHSSVLLANICTFPIPRFCMLISCRQPLVNIYLYVFLVHVQAP